jgi:uncharacterized membrane protein
LAFLIKTFVMISIQNILSFFSLFFSGLIAGLLFSYSCSVNLGLKSLIDNEYLKAMQSINIAIQNPYFLISFIGLVFILPITTVIIYKQQINASFYLMLSATLIYIVGVFGVTLFCNVPLNEQLAKFNISTATTNEILKMRQLFETSWNSYHMARTISAIVSFSLAIISIIKGKF